MGVYPVPTALGRMLRLHEQLIRLNVDLVFVTTEDPADVCDSISAHVAQAIEVFSLGSLNARVVDVEILSSDYVAPAIAEARGWANGPENR